MIFWVESDKILVRKHSNLEWIIDDYIYIIFYIDWNIRIDKYINK